MSGRRNVIYEVQHSKYCSYFLNSFLLGNVPVSRELEMKIVLY